MQIQAQLNRLIEVIKLRDMTRDDKAVKREMALISVGITADNDSELNQLIRRFHAKTVNNSADSSIVEVTGTEDEVNSLIELLRPLGIKKVTRSGVLALYKDLEVR